MRTLMRLLIITGLVATIAMSVFATGSAEAGPEGMSQMPMRYVVPGTEPPQLPLAIEAVNDALAWTASE